MRDRITASEVESVLRKLAREEVSMIRATLREVRNNIAHGRVDKRDLEKCHSIISDRGLARLCEVADSLRLTWTEKRMVQILTHLDRRASALHSHVLDVLYPHCTPHY